MRQQGAFEVQIELDAGRSAHHAPTTSIHKNSAPAFRPEPARNQRAATIMVICRDCRSQRCLG
jgi:hypothetical protein